MAPTRAQVASAVAVTSFAIAAGLRRLTDFDLPWNLASGRVLVETRGIPAHDALAYTHAPLRYVEPLGDVALYAVDRALGAGGLQVAGALACAGLAWALLRATRPGGEGGRVAVWLGLAAMATWLLVRPQLFTFAFLALTLAAIETHRADPASRVARRAMGALVVLQAVWANVHGAAPMGALVLVAYAAHRGLASVGSRRWPTLFPRADATHVRSALAFAALGLIATCLNPAGPRLLLLGLRADEDFGGITEWARPSIAFFAGDEPLLVVIALFVIASLVFARDPRTDARTLPAFDLALVVASFAFAARAVRMAPVAALILAYVAGRRVWTRIDARGLRVVALALAPLPALVVALRAASFGVGFAPRHYPDGAVAWTERAKPRGPMWNFMPFGGWLAYRLYPATLVLMDGRNALARDRSLVTLARDSNTDPQALSALVDELGISWAISDGSPGTAFGAPFARDPARWAMVEMDDVSAVYVRRDGPDASLAQGGYRALTHRTPPGAVLAAAVARDDRAGALSHDGALAATQDPGSARGAFLDGCGALAVRDEARFARALAKLGGLTPGGALEAALRAAWTSAPGRGADGDAGPAP